MSYSITEWIMFIGIAIMFASFLSVPGIFLSQLGVLILVLCFDQAYVNAQPQTADAMEIGGAGVIGVLFRTVLINVVLLPVAVIFLKIGKKYGLHYFGRWRRAG